MARDLHLLRVSSSLSSPSSFSTLFLVSAAIHHHAFLRWLATLAALSLIILNCTSWRTDIPDRLLVPYAVLNLPIVLFNFFRGQFGKWLAFIALIFKLFIKEQPNDPYVSIVEPEDVPSLLLPAEFIIFLVVLPHPLANFFRDSIVGVIFSLAIGTSLLYQHVHGSDNFRNAFRKKGGILNTLGIILLFVSPLWELVRFFQ